MSNLKKLFKNLQTDSESVLVTAEKINDRVLKKLKKSLYKKDKEVVNLFNSNVDFLDHEQKNIPIKTRFVEKKDDTDRSTISAVACWSVLGKSAADSKYCLLFVDLFISKVYIYSMKSRKSIASKMEIFYKEV